LSLVDWFPEADVLKKRETLRQLVQSLQVQLNPDLQYDLQQGSAPVTPQASVGCLTVDTAGDAEVLNPVAAAVSDTDLLQAGSRQCDTSEQKLSGESEDRVSGPLLDCVPGRDETDAAPQIVAASSDSAVDSSLPASDETSSSAVGICQQAPVSTSAAATAITQDVSDDGVSSDHLVPEPNGNKLSADVTDASDKPHDASDSGNRLCQAADTVSHVVDSISDGTVPCVNELLVASAELQKSHHEFSGGDSADS